MSIDSTLYRVCKYLFWVDQMATNIHSGECSLDDVWQIAVDVRLERVRQALASTDDLVIAVRSGERLYEVIDAEVQRHKTAAEEEAAAAAEAMGDASFEVDKASVENEGNGNDDVETTIKAAAATKATILTDSVEPTSRFSDEPTLRISRRGGGGSYTTVVAHFYSISQLDFEPF